MLVEWSIRRTVEWHNRLPSILLAFGYIYDCGKVALLSNAIPSFAVGSTSAVAFGSLPVRLVNFTILIDLHELVLFVSSS